MSEVIKESLVFTVAIVWKSDKKMTLLSSVYTEKEDGIKNYDEALGRAVSEQRKTLDNPNDYTMAMNKSSSSWQVTKRADLSCLRYC